MILSSKKRIRTEVESLLLQEMVADDSGFLLVGDSDGEDIFPDDDEVTKPGLFDNDSDIDDDDYEDDESDEDDSYILDILGRS